MILILDLKLQTTEKNCIKTEHVMSSWQILNHWLKKNFDTSTLLYEQMKDVL